MNFAMPSRLFEPLRKRLRALDQASRQLSRQVSRQIGSRSIALLARLPRLPQGTLPAQAPAWLQYLRQGPGPELLGRWAAWRPPAWVPRRLPGGLKPLVTMVSFGFVLATLLGQRNQLLQFNLDLQGGLWLVLGMGFSLLSLVVNGVAWDVILHWLGLRPRLAATVALHVTTNLRKYLPGGIWHLASRVQSLRSGTGPVAQPSGTAGALVAVLLDPLLMAVAALMLVPAGGWQNGLALVALLPLALLLPRWFQPLLRRLEQRRARSLGLEQELVHDLQTLPPPSLDRYPLEPLLAELCFVVMRFAGFACCVFAFDLQTSLEWPTWLAGFALAWTVGLVVPGAPGGLGVFEAVLLLRLGVVLPAAPVLAVAFSYRLIATVADLLGAVLVGLDERLERRLALRGVRDSQ